MATTPFNLTKSGGIAISDNGTVSDLLNIDLIGPWLRILDLRVALNGLTHTFPDDLDFLLSAPGGANLEFWSDAGDNNDIVNGNFAIADSAASLLPDETPIGSGTYRPAGYGALESASNWGLPASFTVNHPARPPSTRSLAGFLSAATGPLSSGTISPWMPAASRAGASWAPPLSS